MRDPIIKVQDWKKCECGREYYGKPDKCELCRRNKITKNNYVSQERHERYMKAKMSRFNRGIL